MDPATAFSVACGAIQLVGSAIKISKTVHSIVKSSSGLSKEHDAIEESIKTLQASTENARTHPPVPAANAGSTIDADLQKIINEISLKVREECEGLLEKLSKLKVDPNASKTRKVVQAVSAMRANSAIKEYHDKLERLKKELEQTTITRLHGIAQRLIAGDIPGLDRLDENDKSIVKGIAEMESKIDSLTAMTSNVELAVNETKTMVTTLVERQQHSSQVSTQNKFLELMAYKSMFDRERQVRQHPAGEGTCEWVFKPPEGHITSFDSFTEWLKGGESLYWIYGKPGSGKSTLMSYIWEQRQEECVSLLSTSDHPCEVISCAVFFYNPGSPMQRSVEGLLRSLLWQIGKASLDLVDSVSADLSSSWLQANHSPSIALLKKILKTMLNHSDEQRFLFLIDGLDEFQEHKEQSHEESIVTSHVKLLALLRELIACSDGKLKFCVSSRPEPIFLDRLSKTPSLCLQNFTRHPMIKYAKTRLPFMTKNRFFQDLVEKAEGVFLWLDLAINALEHTHYDGSTEAEVEGQLRKLPSRLRGMYELILSKIEPSYMEDAKAFFACCRSGFSLLQCLYSTNPKYRKYLESDKLDQLLEPDKMTEILQDYNNWKTRVIWRTGGLIEVTEHRQTGLEGVKDVLAQFSPDFRLECLIILFKRCVRKHGLAFIHKSVSDFLSETANRVTWLENDSYKTSIPAISAFTFTECILFDYTNNPPYCLSKIRQLLPSRKDYEEGSPLASGSQIRQVFEMLALIWRADREMSSVEIMAFTVSAALGHYPLLADLVQFTEADQKEKQSLLDHALFAYASAWDPEDMRLRRSPYYFGFEKDWNLTHPEVPEFLLNEKADALACVTSAFNPNSSGTALGSLLDGYAEGIFTIRGRGCVATQFLSLVEKYVGGQSRESSIVNFKFWIAAKETMNTFDIQVDDDAIPDNDRICEKHYRLEAQISVKNLINLLKQADSSVARERILSHIDVNGREGSELYVFTTAAIASLDEKFAELLSIGAPGDINESKDQVAAFFGLLVHHTRKLQDSVYSQPMRYVDYNFIRPPLAGVVDISVMETIEDFIYSSTSRRDEAASSDSGIGTSEELFEWVAKV